MSEEKEENFHCKIILVGDSGVGKTSIIGRYTKNYNENEKSTIGASYSSKNEKIDDYTISFDIWDTAGQERYKSVNQIFYKEAYICIMVYDITKKNTFQSIKDYWHKAVKENSSNEIIFGVAGNKIDLYEEEEVDQNGVQEYCDSIGAIFRTTSAKANTYIDDFFFELGKKFVNSDLFKRIEPEVKYKKTNKNKNKKLEKGHKNNKKKFC